MDNLPHNKPSGYDIDLGNQCSQNAFNWAKKTFVNRQGKPGEIALKVDGAFSNMLLFNGLKLGITSDGIGTKIELAERTGIYNTLGYDLVAMVADDLIAGGFVPTSISNILDVDHLHYNTIDQLMQGLHHAANFAGIAVTGGEIAELGNRIGGWGNGMHFNWCSTAIGILHPSLQTPIDGSQVHEGDAVIALRSRGFRSNGFSAVRRIMSQNFGNNWHTQQYTDAHTWGEVLLTPSLIFAPAVIRALNEGIHIKGIAHITGGGIADNFRRVLKVNQLGANLHNLFEPHPFMEELQQLGNLSPQDAYLYWNMGNGMLLVVPQNQVNKAIDALQQGEYKCRIAGHVTNKKRISIEVGSVSLITSLEQED
ncbi:MAG TPA: AIR synthase-related protein [Chitinophagales bacterium]|nr:AIR synthase-related protein [Chitinophagales bacterium]HRK27845.1 AIR synthase-related protein [Chitinophagales bacterium]